MAVTREEKTWQWRQIYTVKEIYVGLGYFLDLCRDTYLVLPTFKLCMLIQKHASWYQENSRLVKNHPVTEANTVTYLNIIFLPKLMNTIWKTIQTQQQIFCCFSKELVTAGRGGFVVSLYLSHMVYLMFDNCLSIRKWMLAVKYQISEVGNTTFPDWIKYLLHLESLFQAKLTDQVIELPQCSEAYTTWPSMIHNIPETARSDQSLDIKQILTTSLFLNLAINIGFQSQFFSTFGNQES